MLERAACIVGALCVALALVIWWMMQPDLASETSKQIIGLMLVFITIAAIFAIGMVRSVMEIRDCQIKRPSVKHLRLTDALDG